METPIHILTIDLSELTDYELIDLACKFGETVSTSRLYDELTDELWSAKAQISAYSELVNK